MDIPSIYGHGHRLTMPSPAELLARDPPVEPVVYSGPLDEYVLRQAKDGLEAVYEPIKNRSPDA